MWHFPRPLDAPLLMLLLLLMVCPATAKEVTVMSYNVENMFDVFDDPYTTDEKTGVKQRDDIMAIAKAIVHADADIVVFQELENEHLLQGMVDTFLGDKGYDYVACQRTNSSRGINLGVISSLPITSLTSHRYKTLKHPEVSDRTWRFARDAMQITVEVEDKELHLFNMHLKSNSSRPGDQHSSYWRTAEAITLKSMIREMVKDDPDALAIALGDFNSNIETRPEQDRPWPATAYLRKPEADGTQLLNDAHDEIASYNKRVTIPAAGKYPAAIFDYIYASPKLHTMLVKSSAKVINDSKLVAGSDHYPVVATYDIK